MVYLTLTGHEKKVFESYKGYTPWVDFQRYENRD